MKACTGAHHWAREFAQYGHTVHYSLRTEETYVQWVRHFLKWHGLRHPCDMAGHEIGGSRFGGLPAPKIPQ